jgi:superfamily I DNA/RNA helicase
MARTIPNKYPGKCWDCKNDVGAGLGTATQPEVKGNPWKLQCRVCASGEVPTPEVATPTATRPTFPLTDEQIAAVALFEEGESIAIQAGAGTGKTSTLVAIAKSTNRLGQYLAFNKPIALDAAIKFAGTNCSAATIHSVALRQVRSIYNARLKAAKPQRSSEIARFLGIDPFFYTVNEEDKVVQTHTLAGYVKQAITNFCNSADKAPGLRHIAYIDGLDKPGEYTNNRKVAQHLLPYIQAAWSDIIKSDGYLRFTYDHYLKIWELGIHGAPIIPGDYILFDEAQDASPVFTSAIEQQGKQVVYVGDAQQAIYEWRGAVNALDNVNADATTYLTNSFRFGEDIAAIANKVLGHIPSAVLRLVGRGAAGKVDFCSTPDAILTRSNAGAITVVLDYLSKNKRVHLVGGGGEVESFAKAAKELQTKGSTTHPELSLFDSWSEVQDYAENDPSGGDLARLVKLIDDNGVENVVRAVSNTVSEEDADIVVSTAHKSKGREWDSVKIAGDFSEARTDDGELRLLYVAVTRARLHLDIESCAPAVAIRDGRFGQKGSQS